MNGQAPDLRPASNFMSLWASAGAVPTEVLLHKGFGRRYLAFPGFLALFQLGLFWGLFDVHFEETRDPLFDSRPLFLYVGLYFLGYLFSLLATIKRNWRGEIEHSRYNGWPCLLPASLGRYERSFKLIVEPGLIGGIGWYWSYSNVPIGLVLMFNAFCMFWSCFVNLRFERRLAMDLQDAVLEQQANSQVLEQLVSR